MLRRLLVVAIVVAALLVPAASVSAIDHVQPYIYGLVLNADPSGLHGVYGATVELRDADDNVLDSSFVENPAGSFGFMPKLRNGTYKIVCISPTGVEVESVLVIDRVVKSGPGSECVSVNVNPDEWTFGDMYGPIVFKTNAPHVPGTGGGCSPADWPSRIYVHGMICTATEDNVRTGISTPVALEYFATWTDEAGTHEEWLPAMRSAGNVAATVTGADGFFGFSVAPKSCDYRLAVGAVDDVEYYPFGLLGSQTLYQVDVVNGAGPFPAPTVSPRP